MIRVASQLLLCLGVTLAAASAQTPDGNSAEAEKIYAERCAECHESGVPRAANREALQRLSPDAIRLALTSGSMLTQAADLSPAQIDMLARMLGRAAPTAPPASTSNACPVEASSSFVDPLDRPRWNGWGANLSQHRFQPAEMAQLPAGQVPRLKIKWSFGFPGVNRAFAQPTSSAGACLSGAPAAWSIR